MVSLKYATFAGGCFWCMVKPFDQWDGIENVVSGYMGGHLENPTYEDVKKGDTGHLEVVQITYNPDVFSYEKNRSFGHSVCIIEKKVVPLYAIK